MSQVPAGTSSVRGRASGEHALPPFADATVAHVVHRGVVTCPPDATLRDAAETMVVHDVHCVVVDGVMRSPAGGERLVWRVLDDVDIVRALAESAGSPGAASAGDVASGPAASVAPADTLGEAASLMLENGLTHLVVASEATGRPVGVLSALDLARALASG